MKSDLGKIEKKRDGKTNSRDEYWASIGEERSDAERSENGVEAVDANDKDEKDAVEAGTVVDEIGVEASETRLIE